MKITDICVV